MIKRVIQRKYSCLSILCLRILFISFLFFISSEIPAKAGTVHLTDTTSHNNGNIYNSDTAVVEAFTTEAIWFGSDEEVTVATRHETPIGKAPGIVTVITAEEIKHLGYRTFIEILRTVPGFEILKKGDFGSVVPVVRGLEGTFKVRMMINGHYINNLRTGEPFTLLDDFPVENIKRVEIIRGPGSAVYGENAFLAVINIITFDAKDIDGVKVSSGYGSFDTKEGTIVFGKVYGNIGISGMARWRETDGFDGIIERDFQTILDTTFGTSASQTPGKANDGRQEYDLNLKVTYKDVYFEGWYINKNQGPFIGPQFALNDESDVENNYVFAEAGYKRTFEERFTVRPRIYYDQAEFDLFIKSLPEGTTIPTASGLKTFPDGLIGASTSITKTVGTEIPFDIELFDGNIITLGMEYRLIDLARFRTLANFNPITLEPLPSLQNLSDTFPFIEETTRRVLSLYLQDTWDITDTLNLTLGIRHDRYNDFGEVTSPRCGLTWSFMKNASLKLLYGEAFRAPSFREMFAKNQPAILGNEDLDPETIRTYEIGLSYKFNKHVTSSMNYFYNDIQDLIILRTVPSAQVTSRFENFGDAHVQGIEIETKVDIIKDNYLFMNYSFQNPEDDKGNDLPFAAQHKGNFGMNIHYWKYINTNLSTFVSGRRSREEGDPRDDLPAFALLNLSIIGKEFFKTLEVQGTVFNLLDKDYNDPGPTSIPDDLPRPGRTFFVGLTYQF